MRTFATLEEAQREPGVILVEATNPPTAYFEGDELPAHCSLEPSHNEQIDAQIKELEIASGGYMRGLREFMLATATVIKQQGGPDFLENKGMQNVKALDDQIRALRAQRQ